MILGSEEFDFRFEVGICEVRLEDRPRIVQLIANYFTVVRVKAQIDQIVDGFKCVGVDELIKSNPQSFRNLFITQPEPVTAELLLKLFTTNFSLEGSNSREDEELVMLYWVNFLEVINCK